MSNKTAREAPTKQPNYLMIAMCAREHLNDINRVQSIIWQMADAVRAGFDGAGDADEIDRAEPEAFVTNVVWLLEQLQHTSAEYLKKELIAAGVQLIQP